ncbi:hypothetical protein COO91_06928 [Nostoc flagelliforme CCNUN1]|uniref:Uncharacterized protein n=1 Tax=Nostoc flagelliforme CCNUN1 TaxID=2038116 RepID=A0A2K8SZN1_9NOSO|nr:hypothetical protein COO91_06928 [Nostoc flagelliforme CCNUN1]
MRTRSVGAAIGAVNLHRLFIWTHQTQLPVNTVTAQLITL